MVGTRTFSTPDDLAVSAPAESEIGPERTDGIHECYKEVLPKAAAQLRPQ